MEIKKDVGGRLAQSVNIFKKNFLSLWLPVFVYNFLAFAVVGAMSMYFIIGFFKNIDLMSFDPIGFFTNPTTIIIISTSIVLFIAYLVLYIPILLGLIKGIKQAVEGKKIDIKENLLFGFSRIFKSFITYWYIFAYVALIPALIFIVGGLFVIVGLFTEIGALVSIGGIFVTVSSLVFIVFAIYRGIRSAFAIYSAVDSDEFNKINFDKSLKTTEGNWWRIVGNFILAGLIIWLVSFIIGLILSVVPYGTSGVYSIQTIEQLQAVINNFSIVPHVVGGFFQTILNAAITVFITIFIYLLSLVLSNNSTYDSMKKNDNLDTNKEL